MVRTFSTALICFTFLAGCQAFAPPPPQAGGHEANLQRKLDYLNQRLNKMEGEFGKIRKANQKVTRLSQQTRADQSVLIEDLRIQVQSLKGTLDVLQHDQKQWQENNRRIQMDIDARLAVIEESVASFGRASSRATTKSKKARKTGDGTANLDAITRYNQILRIILDRKDYDTAINQFEDFLKTYPKSSLSANAQYWLGEGYFAKGNYQRAISEFQKVVDRYPKSEKVCDSILKQGYSFAELKDTQNAKLFLTEVIKRCPKTQAEARAKSRLKSLAQASAKK